MYRIYILHTYKQAL